MTLEITLLVFILIAGLVLIPRKCPKCKTRMNSHYASSHMESLYDKCPNCGHEEY